MNEPFKHSTWNSLQYEYGFVALQYPLGHYNIFAKSVAVHAVYTCGIHILSNLFPICVPNFILYPCCRIISFADSGCTQVCGNIPTWPWKGGLSRGASCICWHNEQGKQFFLVNFCLWQSCFYRWCSWDLGCVGQVRPHRGSLSIIFNSFWSMCNLAGLECAFS